MGRCTCVARFALTCLCRHSLHTRTLKMCSFSRKLLGMHTSPHQILHDFCDLVCCRSGDARSGLFLKARLQCHSLSNRLNQFHFPLLIQSGSWASQTTSSLMTRPRLGSTLLKWFCALVLCVHLCVNFVGRRFSKGTCCTFPEAL